ncbi:MAG: hypothetical protein RBJ76_01330 [Stenomitos frigidus ULC029]
MNLLLPLLAANSETRATGAAIKKRLQVFKTAEVTRGQSFQPVTPAKTVPVLWLMPDHERS